MALKGSRGGYRGPEAKQLGPEFAAILQRLQSVEADLDVLGNSVVGAELTAADVALYFDARGKGVVGKRYARWHVANGLDGYPDWRGRFVRCAAAAGATGGSDSSAHTHSLSAHTHEGAAHTHDVDLPNFTGNSGSEAAHTHASGTIGAEVIFNADGTIDVNGSGAQSLWTSTDRVSGGTWSSVGVQHAYYAHTQGSTAAGSSHLHTINHDHGSVTSGARSASTSGGPSTDATGAASATDNKPAYREVVPLMRLRGL